MKLGLSIGYSGGEMRLPRNVILTQGIVDSMG
ncbi:MAG: hypothetical protein ACI9HA_003758 [Dinoroseobacter sp.]|jgi:hypothetical protein